ncbi:MAG: glycerol-3-phosphate 1-O-acyltransferase PlsY [Candidatus Hydrogenedentes bacterium]|nr:glycerol-3-phosphate 1-O-acyltransferase PlsY [Candidatus Hydrogenedentota bacterium]
MLVTIASIILSYVLGSIPTGLWLGQWLRGIDIREHGSKNIGATNTLRVLGKGLGAAALAGDAAKGIIPVLLVARLSDWPYAPVACGIAAIVGHLASVFLKFKGGKGVATSMGVFLALAPIPILIATAIFATVVGATRMVSAGSISAAIALTITVFALPPHWATAPTHLFPDVWTLRVVVAILAALIVIKHRSNIQRILTGTENRF